MKDTLQERIKKLPQWAQRHIRELEADVSSLKAERQNIQVGDTLVHWCIGLDDEAYLPNRAKVTFITDSGALQCSLRKGRLRVSGDAMLLISLRGSNVLEVAAGA